MKTMSTLELRVEQNKILNNINGNLKSVSESMERQNDNMAELIRMLTKRMV